MVEDGRASEMRRLGRENGERIMIDGTTIPLRDPAGQMVGFDKVLRNLNALKETKDGSRALAEALEQSNVVIQAWDGTIQHWTEGCQRLYGWTALEAIGQVASELLKTCFPVSVSEIQQQLITAGTWQGELRQERKDGSAVFVSAHWVLLANDGEESRLVIATHADITSRLNMQHEVESANERLKRMADELERSNAELEEFARIASHDLSAPIITARWLVDLLASRHGRQLDEEGCKCLEQISVNLGRMSDLVDAVLTHAQVGKNAIGSVEEAAAEDALAIAIENLRKDIATSGAVIARDILPPLPIQSQPLSRLFQNLLSNAIKYRRPGTKPQVTITAVRQGPMWLLGVQDNGIGIEREWHERIFLPLQRRHGMLVAGSGIGLATCKKIVTRAGGRIWVESEAGSGSTFYFTLPAANVERGLN
jgi:PAS domain S-box-containing protein